jgi:hypothetical protein
MATTVVSNFITSAESTSLQIGKEEAGSVKGISTSIATGGALTDNSVIAMCTIPVDANILSIRHWSDDLGTTGDLNLGFYPGNIVASTMAVADTVDEDALATAVDVNAAALADVELRYEVLDINTGGQKAWELAGLSAKPAYDTFHIAYTLSEATTAGGDITMNVTYIS